MYFHFTGSGPGSGEYYEDEDEDYTEDASCETDVIGDETCDDECNTKDYDYDGGDCCMDPVDTEYCTICECKSIPNGQQNGKDGKDGKGGKGK